VVCLDVVLIVMPFASIQRPAIGVSLLKSALHDLGISSKIYYFNIKFAEKIGVMLYDLIAEHDLGHTSLIGELIFSWAAFSSKNLDKRIQIHSIIEKKLSKFPVDKRKDITEQILRAEDIIPEFIHSCALEIIRCNPKLVGFTSTFHQNCASISLARIIKEKLQTPIIFGGANCEGEMGATLLKSVPSIDFICSGEGDMAFKAFVNSLIRDKTSKKINGIITRESNDLEIALTQPVLEMDTLPMPNFDDYFDTLRQASVTANQIQLVMETSRGCWWGEKSQCTFCGLNGSTMKFRSKSINRVLQELSFLYEKYNIKEISIVDNILDLEYIESVFPAIKRKGIPVNLFYETKSNLTKKQLHVMKQGGLHAIQPGIESLSDVILKIMKKGVSGLQNIQLLKWCREIGIIPYWNIIWGFPGEPAKEYDWMANIVPLLVHLHPPSGFGKIVLDRFSPYFLEPEKYGLINIRPLAEYSLVYPFRSKDLEKIAYHFEFDYAHGDPSTHIKGLNTQIDNWQELWNAETLPSLTMLVTDKIILIKDTRPCANDNNIELLANEEKFIYELCDSYHSFQSINFRLKNRFHGITENGTTEFLTHLINKKLMLGYNDKFLSLAVRVN
jgi:ribosomal peptide maturation radical SAM protein 1